MSDPKQMAAIVHLASFAGYLIPFGNIIGPLVVWILKKEEMPFVDAHGREAINFQISILIWTVISIVLMLVLVGIVLLLVVVLVQIICTIIAAVQASNGAYYRYPLTIRFL